MILKDKNIVLGVTGGIAAYKGIELARLLLKEGARVFPIMTRSAMEFIRPLSLETVTGNRVYAELFRKKRITGSIGHIELARKADIIIVAPATANTIGKVANGISDNLVTTVILATNAPVIFAPAMNSRMYENPIVQENIRRLKSHGYIFAGPEEGELACGEIGPGRLSKAETIIDIAKDSLSKKDLSDETVLVTAGPTREAIDPIRFISNSSSGRMGYALAAAARRRGANVILISGPSTLPVPEGVHLINVTAAREMAREALAHYATSTIVFMTAAVSDIRPEKTSMHKIKKEEASITIKLEKTVDILKEMGKMKDKQFLVGFALESENLIKNAIKKLEQKNLDMIVANSPDGIGAFKSQVTVIDRFKEIKALPLLPKEDIAENILDIVAGIKSSVKRSIGHLF